MAFQKATGKIMANGKAIKMADGATCVVVPVADGERESALLEHAYGPSRHVYAFRFKAGRTREACKLARELRAGRYATIEHLGMNPAGARALAATGMVPVDDYADDGRGGMVRNVYRMALAGSVRVF